LIVKLLIEFTGWTGALLILLAYGLLTMRRVAPVSTSYRWLNVAGSAGLVINGAWNGAYPVAFLNIVWLAITLYSLARARADA
jgi:formate hydrogenlyase subunit 3/multisubunit Na+/H+ antiporter MnhD subunit